jgi:hypothetical protein
MNRHLSPDEINAWIIGDRTPAQASHLAECPRCRARADQMETALTQFRAAMRDWSGRQTGAPPPVAQAFRPVFSPRRWVLAAATLLVLSAVPTYRHLAEQRAAERARQDTLLLEQVDSEISRAVPEPMEPLVKLVSWGTGPTTSNKIKESR